MKPSLFSLTQTGLIHLLLDGQANLTRKMNEQLKPPTLNMWQKLCQNCLQVVSTNLSNTELPHLVMVSLCIPPHKGQRSKFVARQGNTLGGGVGMRDNYCSMVSLYYTVVSSKKAIVGLRHPNTIGIHISTEISNTSHPRHLNFLTIAQKYLVGQDEHTHNCKMCTKNARACIFTFTIINYEKKQKILCFYRSRAFKKCNMTEVTWRLRWRKTVLCNNYFVKN